MALSSLGPSGFDQYQKVVPEEGESNIERTRGLMIKNSAAMSRSTSLGSPSSENSNEFMRQNQSEEYDNNSVHADGTLVGFQQNARVVSSTWWGDTNCNNQWNPKCSADARFVEDLSSFQKASIFNSANNIDNKLEKRRDWCFSPGSIHSDGIHESAATQYPGFHKRPNVGQNLQAQKRPCSTANRKSKIQSSAAPSSTDPQSIAAKIRRERISERLKTLQELVPNGSKVDLVTMLEKAINYVKFLQLQVKVLATDEFWPAQGGKAPDISQVKETIDAILSSQRDRTSSWISK